MRRRATPNGGIVWTSAEAVVSSSVSQCQVPLLTCEKLAAAADNERRAAVPWAWRHCDRSVVCCRDASIKPNRSVARIILIFGLTLKVCSLGNAALSGSMMSWRTAEPRLISAGSNSNIPTKLKQTNETLQELMVVHEPEARRKERQLTPPSIGWAQQQGGRVNGSPPSDEPEEARSSHWSLPNRPSLFSIIRFPNEECFDSSNQSGTCYTAFECKLLGGQPSSPCAAGFGSCCIVSRTCHVTTREKVVYFKNPSYPSADSDEKFCDLTVEMSDVNVCQLRVDFLDFQLDPPVNGACKDDYMEISASGMPPQTVPRLCGMNRNQHLYISVPQDFSERSASIVFYTDPVGDHRWQLKVTQIDCNHYRPIDWKRAYGKFGIASSPLWNAHPNANLIRPGLPMHLLGKHSTTFASGFQTMSQTASALAYELLKPQFTPRAPLGCLQYFTQSSGIIESFNFGQYLNNMDYSICVQRQPDTCRVVFTSSDYDWSLNGVGVSGSSSGVGDQDCARDYLLVPGASRTGDGFTYDRYCGGRLHYYRGQALSAPLVIKTSGPIVLRFHSDGHFEGVNNGGFRLQYDQSAQDCIQHGAEEAGSLASQQLLASALSDSRPLNALASVGEPVSLYATQQLSLGPMHELSSTSTSANGGHLSRPAASDDSQRQEQLATISQPQVQRQEHEEEQQANGIKRSDFVANGEQAAFPAYSSGQTVANPWQAANWLQPEQPEQQQQATDAQIAQSTTANKRYETNHKLLANLNKAFQLITARSQRL